MYVRIILGLKPVSLCEPEDPVAGYSDPPEMDTPQAVLMQDTESQQVESPPPELIHDIEPQEVHTPLDLAELIQVTQTGKQKPSKTEQCGIFLLITLRTIVENFKIFITFVLLLKFLFSRLTLINVIPTSILQI